MDPNTNLVQKYIDADDEHRLGLFLAYRDMRDTFSRIEQEELEANRSAAKVQKSGQLVNASLPQLITEHCRGWMNFCKSLCC